MLSFAVADLIGVYLEVVFFGQWLPQQGSSLILIVTQCFEIPSRGLAVLDLLFPRRLYCRFLRMPMGHLEQAYNKRSLVLCRN